MYIFHIVLENGDDNSVDVVEAKSREDADSIVEKYEIKTNSRYLAYATEKYYNGM